MAEIKLYLDEDISHTVAEVLRSRGYVLKLGKVVFEGTPDELRQEGNIQKLYLT
ncbi:MAG: hypothetical protein MAG551_02027 [Candidatus Scalindua arabica]|uniref:DUF5615 domain-containing protein n=1 Tax=Candidatus Scalindua arabica TaxID=1127984 RepID=A0A941W491_9BACT|nr:hypothetical protein [Candidatus Scalindua arabica]